MSRENTPSTGDQVALKQIFGIAAHLLNSSDPKTRETAAKIAIPLLNQIPEVARTTTPSVVLSLLPHLKTIDGVQKMATFSKYYLESLTGLALSNLSHSDLIAKGLVKSLSEQPQAIRDKIFECVCDILSKYPRLAPVISEDLSKQASVVQDPALKEELGKYIQGLAAPSASKAPVPGP